MNPLTVTKSFKMPFGNRYRVVAEVTGVNTTGDYVSSSGIGIDFVDFAWASASGEPTPVGVTVNARGQSDHASADGGDVFLVALSGTPGLVYLDAVGR